MNGADGGGALGGTVVGGALPMEAALSGGVYNSPSQLASR